MSSPGKKIEFLLGEKNWKKEEQNLLENKLHSFREDNNKGVRLKKVFASIYRNNERAERK